MEIKAELKYPYSEEERTHFIIEQNHRNGYEIKEVPAIYEYEEKVLEFDEVEEQQPIAFDEETGEPTEYETVIVKKPIMIIVEEEIQVPIYDEETDDITGYETKTIEKEIQKFHYETREKEVIDLEAWGYTEEEKKQQERERLDALTLTGADVERAIYEAKGMDFEDLVQYVINTGITGFDIKRLKIELKANNFYRGHEYINMIGQMLGYTSDDMDILFTTKHLPVKEEEVEDGDN